MRTARKTAIRKVKVLSPNEDIGNGGRKTTRKVHPLKVFSKICLLASAANRDGGDNNRRLRNGHCGENENISIVGLTTFTFSLDMQSELWEAHPSSAT
jgi:hypothetical protein